MAELVGGEKDAQSLMPTTPPPPSPPPPTPLHVSHAISITNIIKALQIIADTSERTTADEEIYVAVKLSVTETLKKGLISIRDALNKEEKTVLEEILVITRKTQ